MNTLYTIQDFNTKKQLISVKQLILPGIGHKLSIPLDKKIITSRVIDIHHQYKDWSNVEIFVEIEIFEDTK